MRIYEATALFLELRARGIELQAYGKNLRFRPLSAVDQPLLARMAEHKEELLRLISLPPTEDAGDTVPLTLDLFGIRTVEDLLALDGDGSPPSRCYACRGAHWWRLRRGGPWVCIRCHSTDLPTAMVEIWQGEGAGR